MKGPATLNGLPGSGLMEILRHGGLKETRGYFALRDPDDRTSLLESFNRAEHSVYEGPVRDLAGRVQRMRVKVLLTSFSFGTGEPVSLVGSGPPLEIE